MAHRWNIRTRVRAVFAFLRLAVLASGMTAVAAAEPPPDPPALGMPFRFGDLPRHWSGMPASGWLAGVLRAEPDRKIPGTAVTLEYLLNCPPFEPGVTVRRWVALPARGRLGFRVDGDWSLPPGCVLVRHTLRADRPVETRLLVVTGPAEAYGASYRWRGDGSDAERVDDADLVRFDPEHHWLVPGSEDGLPVPTGHLQFFSDLSTRQLNRPEAADDPIARWSAAGWLTGVPEGVDRGALPRLVPPDARVAAEWRVRSYLDVHCAPCHQPGGAGRGLFDARYETPLARSGLIGGTVSVNAFGLADAQILRPGDPANSVMVYRLARTDAYRMPPAQFHPYLSPILPVLEQWIREMASAGP